jgi:hypothetical protein
LSLARNTELEASPPVYNKRQSLKLSVPWLCLGTRDYTKNA